MSDEEDVQICKHEAAIEKAKHTKEEQQRQWEEEAQKKVEAKAKEAQRKAEEEEWAQKEAERVWVEDERRKKVEVRMAAALERLMRWIEVTNLELDGEESEKSEVGEREEWKTMEDKSS